MRVERGDASRGHDATSRGLLLGFIVDLKNKADSDATTKPWAATHKHVHKSGKLSGVSSFNLCSEFQSTQQTCQLIPSDLTTTLTASSSRKTPETKVLLLFSGGS